MRKNKYRQEIIKRLTKSNYVYLAYCNLVGGQDELVFDGNSMVFMPDGEIIAAAKAFEEDLLIADILPSEVNPKMFSIQVPQNIPPLNAIDLTKYKSGTKAKLKSMRIEEALKADEEIYKALVLGTSDYIHKNGFTDVVIGLFGGIDSALTAVIAHDCVGSEHLHLVFMPSEYTSDQSTRDAARLAENLGVEMTVSYRSAIHFKPTKKCYPINLRV